jgi:hypothetical protein
LQFLIKKRFFSCTRYRVFFSLQVLVIKKLDPDLLKLLYPNLYLYLIHNTDFNRIRIRSDRNHFAGSITKCREKLYVFQDIFSIYFVQNRNWREI